MAEMLRCHDPLGRLIMLSRERWDDHILLHGEMAGEEEAVRRALTEPLFIMSDKHRRDVENYYLPFALSKPFNLYYLKVCDRFLATPTGTAAGTVLTAFATDRTPAGEVEIWPGQK